MKINKVSMTIAFILIIIDICFMILSTYAYFTVDLRGESNPIEVKSFDGNASIVFTDTSNVSMVNAYTGDEIDKTFKIENTSDYILYYDIKLVNVTNNFENINDLVYTLNSTNGGAYRSESIIPSTDALIASRVMIKPHTTHEYNMKITFLKTEFNQSGNMNKTYSSNISIIPTEGINIDQELYKNNTIEKIMSFESLGYDTSEKIDGVYYTNSSINGKKIYYYRGSNKLNNNVLLNNVCYKILRTTYDDGVRLVYNGIYEDGKCSNTKILENKEKYNNKSNFNAYIGFMYGDASSNNYKVEHNNVNSSNIKSVLESYYKENLIDINDLISNETIYCNNRKTIDYKEKNVLYTRLGYGNNNTGYFDSNMISPSYDCIQEEDRFSVMQTGNQALNYSIGLLTYDEMLYAGLEYNKENKDNFLYTKDDYFTMTPAYFSGSDAYMFSNIKGKPSRSKTTDSLGIRPVITIKKDTNIKSGDGSIDSPYIIK